MRLKLIIGVLVLTAQAIPVTADEVDDLILDLKFGAPGVRVNAVIALGNISDPKAVEPLIDDLQDGDGTVRSEAASAFVPQASAVVSSEVICNLR